MTVLVRESSAILENAAAALCSPARMRVLESLAQRQFFKLILGGSFSDTAKIAQLVTVYAQAGIEMIDCAPELPVLEAVAAGLRETGLPQAQWPMVMVSLPLDPDPHFRKIELLESLCIACDACIPICPTQALSVSADNASLIAIDQPLCYGCGRCVPTCPTTALVLNPLYSDPSALLDTVLAHPLVGAVEIHSRYMDPVMMAEFLAKFSSGLANKLLSVCFRPNESTTPFWQASLAHLRDFVTQAQGKASPLIVQIDGAPMSGSHDRDASLPSLHNAQHWITAYGELLPAGVALTLSGGINLATPQWLSQLPVGHHVQGVGVGTVARQWVWHELELGQMAQAVVKARRFVSQFR